MSALQIRYKNGIPTKKSLLTAIKTFDSKLKIDVNPSYGKEGIGNALIWHDDYTQQWIGTLQAYLTEVGVKGFSKKIDYDRFVPGSLGWLYITPIEFKKKRHGNKVSQGFTN